jgi:hypothetical protein
VLDGARESGDKARMHATHDVGRAVPQAASGMAASPVVRRSKAAYMCGAECRGARWQRLKARTTVPLRIRDNDGAV